MDALESLVRDVLREHASDAPITVPPIRRRHTGWLVAGASAAAVVLLAVGAAVLRGPTDSPLGSGPGPANSQSVGQPSASTPVVPDGYRRTGYHDITLLVPEGLPTSTTGCVLPREYVLAQDMSAVYDCVASPIPASEQTLTITLTAPDAVPGSMTTEPVQVNGIAGRIGYGALPPTPGVAGVAVFPGIDFAVIATAPDRATVETILTSVKLGADPQGCPAHRVAPANAPADVLIPAGATGGLRCVYGGIGSDGDLLLATDPVRAAKLAGLVDAINALPPRSGTVIEGGPAFERDLLRFDYVDGSARTLTVDMSDPTLYSDGTRTGMDDDNHITDLLREAAP